MSKKIRTQEEIKKQIEGLLQMKETLPEKSFFGDNNWEKIDLQVAVLKGEVDADSLWHDESAEEYQESDNEDYRTAIEVEDWLEGHIEEDLFE